jgi:hypothetical protein
VIESIYIASLLKIPVLSWSVGWILFNCLFAAIGVIIYEGVFEYAPDEDKYDLKSRRGDLFFGGGFAIIITAVSPYFWDFLDGRSVWTWFTFTSGWFNPAISFLTGFTWIIIAPALIAVVKGLSEQVKRKTK